MSTTSGLTLAAAVRASVMLVDTTHTGGLEGMQRTRIADEFLALRGGNITGSMDSKDSNMSRLLLLAFDSLPPCSSSTTIRGESSVRDTPSAETRDVARICRASNALLHSIPAFACEHIFSLNASQRQYNACASLGGRAHQPGTELPQPPEDSSPQLQPTLQERMRCCSLLQEMQIFCFRGWRVMRRRPA